MLTAFADSEYGCLRDALLCCPPDLYSVRSVSSRAAFPDIQTAVRQHENLVAVLESEGVRCHVMTSAPSKFYQSYMRDCYVITPWGFLLAKMGFGERAREPEAIRKYAVEMGLPIWKTIEQGSLEGGDVQLLAPGYAVVGTNGQRTSIDAATQVKTWFEEEGWKCRVIKYPSNYVHLDVAMGVLDSKNIIFSKGAIQPLDCEWIQSLGFQMHPLPAQDPNNMVCNILSLGKKRIVSSAHNKRCNALLERLGFQVIGVDISQFIANHGGVHCLVNPLQREHAQQAKLVSDYQLRARPA